MVESTQIERIARALPDYEVDAELGRGAMGVVYGGRHRKLDRAVAIKELPEAFAADAGVRRRFNDEARTLASLSHPHVVPIFDYVERDGQCLLVMEALPGGTVWERFVDRGLTMSEACATVLATCAGLHHAHTKGVLHRDVKPENLMLSADNDLKVTDFGIAKVVNGATQQATAEGAVLGTPAYMAPEQGEGLEVDARADVYAVGTMLYELLSGRLPFDEGETPLDLLVQRSNNEPKDLGSIATNVPQPIAAVTMRAIARRPADRFASAEEFGVALGEAAAVAWGPQWIDSTTVRVQGSEPISMAARTTTASGSVAQPDDRMSGRRSADPTVAPGERGDTNRSRGDATIGPDDTAVDADAARATASPQADDASTEAPPRAPETEQVNVRPQQVRRAAAPDLAEISPAQLVNVAEVVKKPKVPAWKLLVGLALAAVGVVVALVGLGEPELDPPVGAATISINGTSLDADDIEIDLSEAIEVSGVSGSEVDVSFRTAGVPLGATERVEIDGDPVEIEPALARWAAGGAVTGTVTVYDAAGAVAGEHDFLATTTQPWYLTATGLGAILVLLFSVATIESNLAPLRRGRRRPTALLGLFVAAAVTGVGLCLLAMAILGVHVTVPAVVVSALALGVGFVLIGMFVTARGKSRRVVKVAKARGLEVQR